MVRPVLHRIAERTVAPAATDLLIGCGKGAIETLALRMFARSAALKPGAARHRLRRLRA
jgi:hypothetical protein